MTTRAAFLAWNAAQQRARNEYAAHPIAACGVTDCTHLAVTGNLCRYHRRKPKDTP